MKKVQLAPSRTRKIDPEWVAQQLGAELVPEHEVHQRNLAYWKMRYEKMKHMPLHATDKVRLMIEMLEDAVRLTAPKKS